MGHVSIVVGQTHTKLAACRKHDFELETLGLTLFALFILDAGNLHGGSNFCSNTCCFGLGLFFSGNTRSLSGACMGFNHAYFLSFFLLLFSSRTSSIFGLFLRKFLFDVFPLRSQARFLASHIVARTCTQSQGTHCIIVITRLVPSMHGNSRTFDQLRR